ncbi:BBP7 family outer membrane beta-barrel protein [Aeoliella mucimassa]|uniref:Legionella pneumophila major outer membrane protein n=1 Tax=Aeoliella mucimassa TaxID=2527972 RepID=A0A518AMP4_9BACT|nr:BBP7 family outer membrane beta-barrel protein [Aeoliella mucimassa]QDU56004.1 hypothetical protein Pan181_22060 [Aeoliella mucimassa]
MRCRSYTVRFAVACILHTVLVQTAQAQTTQLGTMEGAGSDIVYSEPVTPKGSGSSAYPNGDFYRQLGAASGQGGSCGTSGCGEWGCGGSPYRTGPGCGDDWKVGPRWRIQADGIFLFRDEVDLDPLATQLGTTLDALDQYENFDHSAGARLVGTAYYPQCKNYELVLGYIGVDDYNASLIMPVTNVPAVVGPPASVALDERRSLNYSSSLHALELNFQALNTSYWKPYAGVRYFSLDEVVRDETHQYPSVPLAIGDASITSDALNLHKVENNLIGFQMGVRRDLWNISQKVYFQGFANSGIYCNMINRSHLNQITTTTTEVLDDDPATTDTDETGTINSNTYTTGNRVKTERTELSFAGEASVALIWKINSCFALRTGYEVMYITDVELANDAYLGLNDTHDMLYHGGFAGFEYRR